jgi:acyl dehydratase
MEPVDEQVREQEEAPKAATNSSGGRHLTGPEAWLRPFDELKEGDTFVSKSRTITEADVVQFAALTGDWHPAHSDATWAEENIFGQRVAHGMLVVCYAIGLVPNDYIMALRRMKTLVFKRPVFFGDTIHVEGKVAKMASMSEEVGMVTGRWKIVNQKDETIAKLELEALWRRKPFGSG